MAFRKDVEGTGDQKARKLPLARSIIGRVEFEDGIPKRHRHTISMMCGIET